MKINYSIVSRGTEKYSNHGYMAVSFDSENGYLFNSNHGMNDLIVDSDTLVFKNDYTILNIAISRFCLISRLFLERVKLKDNILICGFGNIGFSLLIELLKEGYKNISIYSRNISKNIDNIEKKYNLSINIVDEISDIYDTYIDTTGSSKVLKNIFEKVRPMSAIIILSTPREEEFLINPLIINRKNLSVYGGHEIFGVNLKYRKELFNRILNENKNLEGILDEYVSVHVYSEEKIKNIINKKSNFIDILKY